MFAYGVNTIGSVPLAAMAYFRAGMSITNVVLTIADWHFGGIDKVGSLLDFAAGYGRSTRFLAKHLPAERVTAGEIQADALEFQAREFGVKTLLSASDPVQLEDSKQFDLIFVSSLFTHLPDRTFGLWLARLWDLVAPGGVLAFSVHDEVVNELGIELEDGFVYVERTEVTALSTDEYGGTVTNEAYVRRKLYEAIGADAEDAVRLPRALCFHQDMWVLSRGQRNVAPLEYDHGPNGALDRADVDGHELRLTGWAADVGFAAPGAPSHALSRVEVHVGEKIVVADLGLPRPDIAAHLGRENDRRMQLSGWSATVRLTRRVRETDIVTVLAICEHGQRFVLDSTLVSDVLARTGANPVTPSLLRSRTATARRLYREGGVGAVVARAIVVARRELGRS